MADGDEPERAAKGVRSKEVGMKEPPTRDVLLEHVQVVPTQHRSAHGRQNVAHVVAGIGEAA
jgi:hypothetical protein